MRHLALAALVLVALLVPRPAYALVSEIWGYVKQYQLGIDYTNSYDKVDASYEIDKTGGNPEGCADVTGEPTRQRCTVEMQGGSSSGFGLFLQQAFRKQGQFYFKADVGFGARYLNGALDEQTKKQQAAAGLPLKDLRFSLAAFVVKPYLKFGVTPASRWPDIFLSLGPAAQIALGKVKVNDESSAVAVATSSDLLSGFFELEIVFWRFGDGALSIFYSKDFTGDGRGTKFYPKGVDKMDDIRANFSRDVSGGFLGLGAKLVLDWP